MFLRYLLMSLTNIENTDLKKLETAKCLKSFSQIKSHFSKCYMSEYYFCKKIKFVNFKHFTAPHFTTSAPNLWLRWRNVASPLSRFFKVVIQNFPQRPNFLRTLNLRKLSSSTHAIDFLETWSTVLKTCSAKTPMGCISNQFFPKRLFTHQLINCFSLHRFVETDSFKFKVYFASWNILKIGPNKKNLRPSEQLGKNETKEAYYLKESHANEHIVKRTNPTSSINRRQIKLKQQSVFGLCSVY